MKPRNKKQQHIVELSGRLRPLTTPQMNWALNSTINHYGYRLKNGMCTCMKCGHEWLETRNGTCLCPECGTQIEIKDTKERVIREKSYFNIITTIEDYQVVRMFLMIVEMRKGMKVKPAYLEIGQYLIDPKGNKTVVGLQRTLGYYIDSFAFGSPLEIRCDNEAFQRISDEWVYPRIKVTDTIKRNGFKGSCHHIHPVTLFQELLTNPKAETLMKANDIELLRYLCARHIVYNRVNMSGKAVDERNNFRRSDRVVKAIKDKYGLTYSPLKQKYEDKIPVFKERISQAIYGCKSWDEFSRRLAYAGIEVKFHDDHNTGKHIGVKFTDGDITVNGSKIDRAFTYRRLNNLFDFNRKHGQQPSDHAPAHPKVTVEYTPTQKSSLVEDVLEATVGAIGNLFTLGPGFDPEEQAFQNAIKKEEARRKRKSRKI